MTEMFISLGFTAFMGFRSLPFRRIYETHTYKLEPFVYVHNLEKWKPVSTWSLK